MSDQTAFVPSITLDTARNIVRAAMSEAQGTSDAVCVVVLSREEIALAGAALLE